MKLVFCFKTLLNVSARVHSANFRNLWFGDRCLDKVFQELSFKKKIHKKIFFQCKVIGRWSLLHVNCFDYPWQVLSFWSYLYVNTSRNKSHGIVHGIILSRNTFARLVQIPSKKKKRSCPFSSTTARRKIQCIPATSPVKIWPAAYHLSNAYCYCKMIPLW